MDTLTRGYQCTKCPKNHYSSGGGLSIDGSFGEWTDALKNTSDLMTKTVLDMHCYKFFWFTWLSDGCKSCSANLDGSALECGTSDARETSVAFENVMKVFFVKKGKIEFLYRKDSSREKDGWISGIFSFYVDETSLLDDDDLNDDPNEWKYFSYDVYPGMKEITFLYQKYNSD